MRGSVAITIWSLLVAPGNLGVLRAAFPNGPAAPNQGTVAKPATVSPAPADGEWPRSYLTKGGARLIVRRTGGATGNTAVGVSGSGDMYAGHDGNVYKKEGDSWQKYDNGSWSSVSTQQAQDRATQARSTASASGFDSSQLNRDSAARSEGAQRTKDAGAVRSGASASSGSYRASGGGGRRR
jgi:hypothetical protein